MLALLVVAIAAIVVVAYGPTARPVHIIPTPIARVEMETSTPKPATEPTDTGRKAVLGVEAEVAEAYLPLMQSTRSFLETFSGSPSTAQPWRPSEWDVAVHARDGINGKWRELPAMAAMHGADCSAPPATHGVTTYEDAVFKCKDHMMTAINAGGYGVIYLTPNHMVDFSQGEAIIRFDLSTLRTSSRDWIDLWITPYDENIQLPLQDWLPDLQGEPRNAVHIRMDGNISKTTFRATVVRNFQAKEVEGKWWRSYQDVLVPDAKRRDTFELRISQTHLAFGMPQYNLWWIDSDIQELGWNAGVVQLGHHTYTPTKNCSSCGPNTWHWDNVSVSPARPFTIIRGQQRLADQETNGRVTFPQGAPAGAHLRFAAFGKNIEVSFDNGASWQPARKQAQEKDDQGHASSYWTAVPQGVTSVQLRGQSILNYGWHAQDFAIWSLSPTPAGVR